MAIGILSTGSFLPRRVVTNKELESVVDTTDAWIVSRTGIRERRRAEDGAASSDLGTIAGMRALHSGGLSQLQIDGLVVATSSPDHIQPATACVLQAKLGMGAVTAFDVSAVCTGFVYGLTAAVGMMRGFPQQYRRMLVVGAEAYSRILDPTDRTTSVFFGDGAGAVVLGEVPDGYGVLSAHLMADGTQAEVVGVPAGGSAEPASHATVSARRHYFHMNGPKVWEFATTQLPSAIKEALLQADLGVEDVDLMITHQANARLIEAVGAAVGISQDKVALTVERYGNTAAASVPITLDEAVAAGRVKRGDVVVLASVGGGMTAGAVVLRWY
ncbi:3-oxoacyl-ACP synthase III family protein [Lentzea albida]|uniref:Beta-ketoacyl-[acyl-carrier-protein] synthase III n=1 Tax=Lentzea albida TaxID=65499 RepID=A0A1H9WHQ7_9PSEU|nr:beta-ketoacyl-ACP synthase III [Lentzea albida]SES33217.1 3-oxoacyl-[acyl-carrier-protein] synthase-3 [Lentzea albida]